MNELHLFAGAGGGILGGILLGHTCVCAVEIEPYCRKVLLQRQRDGILPKFPIWDDVRTFDGKPWRGKVDVVCGGFPCQDISIAGGGHDYQENGQDFGKNFRASFAKLDRNMSLWKTAQLSLFGDLELFSQTWPRWGFMRDGECWELPTPGLYIYENASGYLPTCRKVYMPSPNRNGKESENYHSNLEDYLGAKKPWPKLSEVMMGWPIMWTSVTERVEMDKFQQWLNSHGKSYQDNSKESK